jgi:hypothetical protein
MIMKYMTFALSNASKRGKTKKIELASTAVGQNVCRARFILRVATRFVTS